jgi:hypothetical protein
MKKTLTILLSLLFLLPVSAEQKAAEKKDSPVKEHLQNHFKLYGFIRNFFVYDSRDSKAGTGDLFYYLPLDNKWNTADVNNPAREDLNASPNFRFLALTSRVAFDVSGYYINNLHFGAKVEGDFYSGLAAAKTANGLSGNTSVSGTAQARLRQAYVTLTWKDLPMRNDKTAQVGLKIGQAWHPMAADMPHVFSLEAGAPFGPFSRTPQVTMDAALGEHWILSAAAIWQQQYQSAGPDGASAAYMKYACTPEVYAAVTLKGKEVLFRGGVDVVSIKPRNIGKNADGLTVHVKDRKTSVLGYLYGQYNHKLLSIKAKTTFGEGGEHMNLMSGYAVVDKTDPTDWKYASMLNSSSWLSLCYGKKWQGVLYLGYVKNFGLADKVAPGYIESSDVYFCGNGFSNINQMYRINPQLLYNLGKFTLGLEYQWTAVQYGDYRKGEYTINGKQVELTSGLNALALATENLHWVGNNRVNMMVKFTF